MIRRRTVAFVALCFVALSSGVARPTSAQSIHTIGRVIATGGVDGRFARPVCVGDDYLRPSDHAGFSRALARAAREPDRPLVIDTGGLLTPHGVARYAAEVRPATLSRLVQGLGYRALALGLNDLAAPRAPMMEVLSRLRADGVPMLASNLRCTEDAHALCDILVDASDGPSMHIVSGRRTAVLSVLRPEVLNMVAPDRAEGLVLEDPVESLARLTRLAREQSAELVIAVVDGWIEGGALQLATELPEGARPDLILVSGPRDLLFARPRTVQPVLVGTPTDDAVEIRIRESSEIREGYEMLAQPLGDRAVNVGEPVRRWIERIERDYCAAWGRPLAGGRLDEPIDAMGLGSMVTSILRERSGADIAIINRASLDRSWRPAHAQQGEDHALTASDIYIALEYDEPLYVAEVDAAWLEAMAAHLDTRDDLIITGMSGTPGSVEIGGHPVESRARYRVVTTRFLASGGDSVLTELTPAGNEWQPYGGETLRARVIDFLEEERSVDPRDALPDPHGTTEWTFRADADLTFSGSRIDNPFRRCGATTPADRCVDGIVVDEDGNPVRAYATAQLLRSDLLTFGITVDLAANAAAPDWTWQNVGSLVYRTTWREPPAGSTSSGFVEALDQIRTRSTLSWRGLRQQHVDAGNEGWYVPDPTVDLFIESELSEPAGRGFHWFLTRPTAGLRFQLFDKLQLQMVGGIEAQPFDPQGEIVPGLGATLTLSPWDVMTVSAEQYARLSFTFDYFLADPGDEPRGALRGVLDMSFAVVGPARDQPAHERALAARARPRCWPVGHRRRGFALGLPRPRHREMRRSLLMVRRPSSERVAKRRRLDLRVSPQRGSAQLRSRDRSPPGAGRGWELGPPLRAGAPVAADAGASGPSPPRGSCLRTPRPRATTVDIPER